MNRRLAEFRARVARQKLEVQSAKIIQRFCRKFIVQTELKDITALLHALFRMKRLVAVFLQKRTRGKLARRKVRLMNEMRQQAARNPNSLVFHYDFDTGNYWLEEIATAKGARKRGRLPWLLKRVAKTKGEQVMKIQRTWRGYRYAGIYFNEAFVNATNHGSAAIGSG